MASAQKENESLKKHGDAMDKPAQESKGKGAKVVAIPAPESGSHDKSHAAHLKGKSGNAQEDTHRQGAHPGASPGELRQPPQEIGRVGKEHRKQ
jgi:hypothetical protein